MLEDEDMKPEDMKDKIDRIIKFIDEETQFFSFIEITMTSIVGCNCEPPLALITHISNKLTMYMYSFSELRENLEGKTSLIEIKLREGLMKPIVQFQGQFIGLLLYLPEFKTESQIEQNTMESILLSGGVEEKYLKEFCDEKGREKIQ